MANEKDFEIIINATKHTVADEVVTFKQVVDLAFPGHPADPNMVFSVTFEHVKSQPHEGTLAEGGSVTVHKEKTIFDVTQTIRS